MTKLYSLENDTYVKTDCKSKIGASTVTVNASKWVSSTTKNTLQQHTPDDHTCLQKPDGYSPFSQITQSFSDHNRANRHDYNNFSSLEDLRDVNLWNRAPVRDLLVSGFESVKPLTLHNLSDAAAQAANDFPPIVYINGNTVRPIRCRHYSAQQTAPAVQQQLRHQQCQYNTSRMNDNIKNVSDMLVTSLLLNQAATTPTDPQMLFNGNNEPVFPAGDRSTWSDGQVSDGDTNTRQFFDSNFVSSLDTVFQSSSSSSSLPGALSSVSSITNTLDLSNFSDSSFISQSFSIVN